VAGACALILLALAVPVSALAAPVLGVSSTHLPADAPVPQGTYARYEVAVSNTGTTATSAPVSVELAAPAGLEVTKAASEPFSEFTFWSCSIAGDAQSAGCTGPELFGESFPIEAGEEACEGLIGDTCRILITVRADPGAPLGALAPTITACGGGASVCPATAATAAADPIEIVPLAFDITSFDGSTLESNGDPATLAGSHPATATTDFFTTTLLDPEAHRFSTEDLKDAVVRLPPGLIDSPQAAPTCTQEELLGQDGLPQCPAESQVGTVVLHTNGSVGPYEDGPAWGVYNMEAGPGTPALFAFNVFGNTGQLYAKLRTGGDYGVSLIEKNAPQVTTLQFEGAKFTFWGIPADPSHDAERYCPGLESPGCPSVDAVHPKPFLTLPTSCPGPVLTSLELTSWQGGSAAASFLSHDNGGTPIGATGCNALDFSPTLEARPTTNVADAPSGLDVDLHLPQNEDVDGTAEAHLKDATITLPEGFVVNPAGANGLEACSQAQVGLHDEGPANCPDDAKLGTVQVETPLLDHPLPGAVYIATPYGNPFGSLLAIYVAIDDPESGTVVKLAGEVTADPQTGRLSASFEENPQLPFEDFSLHFFGGAGGALRTPVLCGSYTTTSSLTPWSAPDSGPPATPSDAYGVERAASGGACPTAIGQLPNSPSFDAGTVLPLAGLSSPFVLNLSRQASTESFDALGLTAPPGLTAALKGIPYCSEAALAGISSRAGTAQAEAERHSCPAASRVGTVTVGAGAGPEPFFLSGGVYLAGPHRSAPLSLAVVLPVLAGPFDLGSVVLRIAVQVDPLNAQLRLMSDPLPRIVSGIPLDLRELHIALDRPGFTRNPTSCDPTSITGTAGSPQGGVVGLSSRFQVGGCGDLGLKPRFEIRFSGATGRNGHPTLTALLRPRPGDTNLSAATVVVPRGELIDPRSLTKVCTRRRFAAGTCPAGSIQGWARVWSPLLDDPLEGRIYLRESSEKYPDLAVELKGRFDLALVGHVRTASGTIRARFDSLPDVPVSRLKLVLEGGRRGILVNSDGLCRDEYRATFSGIGHDGTRRRLRPRLAADCRDA
jgi:hypothetical protein